MGQSFEIRRKTNNDTEEFEQHCMQKGLQESNFLSSSNVDQYIT